MIQGDYTLLFFFTIATTLVASAIFLIYLVLSTESDLSAAKGLIALSLGLIAGFTVSLVADASYLFIALTIACTSAVVCIAPSQKFKNLGDRCGWERPGGKKFDVKRMSIVVSLLAVCASSVLMLILRSSVSWTFANFVAGCTATFAFFWVFAFILGAVSEAAFNEVCQSWRKSGGEIKRDGLDQTRRK